MLLLKRSPRVNIPRLILVQLRRGRAVLQRRTALHNLGYTYPKCLFCHRTFIFRFPFELVLIS